jgi:hypothetical protein
MQAKKGITKKVKSALLIVSLAMKTKMHALAKAKVAAAITSDT